MFNKIKREGKLPDFMKNAVISTISKKGSQFMLKNERGIFLVSSVRSILMKLEYNSKYKVINDNMSESNIGGRKNRSSVDNIFIINGIIHEQLSNKNNKPLTLQIYDYQQMFDSMDLEIAISDLFDSGIQDDYLVLIYDANQNIKK